MRTLGINLESEVLMHLFQLTIKPDPKNSLKPRVLIVLGLLISALICSSFHQVNAAEVVLFLDFNLSAGEVAAARKAVSKQKKSQMRFEVLPKMTKDELVEITKLKSSARALRAQYEVISQKVLDNRKLPFFLSFLRAANFEKKARDLALQIQTLENHLKTIQKTHAITSENVGGFLEAMKLSGHTLSTLIISGHSRGDQFWGSLGEKSILDRDELMELLGQYSKEKSTFSTLYLWGCYGGTVESINSWSSRFPKLKQIFAFSGSAPSGVTPESISGIEDLLIGQYELGVTSTKQDVESWMLARKPLSKTLFVAKSEPWFFGVKQATILFESLKVDCHRAGEVLNPQVTTFKNYFNAESEEFADPPNEFEYKARSAVSPLRIAYELFQTYSVCQDEFPDMPDRAIVVALIHFQKVQQNFAQTHVLELGRFSEYLQSLGAPKSLAVPVGLSFGAASRSSVIRWGREISEWLENFPLEKLKQRNVKPKYYFIERFYQEQIASVLIQLEEAPPTWMTE